MPGAELPTLDPIELAVERLLASREAQGFPARISDPTVLARIAAVLA